MSQHLRFLTKVVPLLTLHLALALHGAFGLSEQASAGKPEPPANTAAKEEAIADLELAIDTFTEEKNDPGKIQRLEQRLIEEIGRLGPGDRLVIHNLSGSLLAGRSSGKCTFVSAPFADEIKIGEGGTLAIHAGFPLALKFELPGDGVQVIGGVPEVPFGEGSVHRFHRGVILQVDDQQGIVVMNGQGDRFHRLTFAIVPGVGYVYLRGQGSVRVIDILGDREISLDNSLDNIGKHSVSESP